MNLNKDENKMKTRKQLEKGCGSYNINSAEFYLQQGVHSTKIYCGSEFVNELCKNCQATLTQTNEIIKLIEERLDYYDNQPMTSEFSKGFQHSCNMFRKELLTKIKGDYE